MSEDGAQSTPGAPVPVRRARYDHPLAHYVAIFGRKERALKGWIAIGRDATPPELPPFDQPARMKDWWTRHKHQRVPDELSALAIAAPAAAVTVTAPPADSSPPSDASAGPLFAAAASAPPAVFALPSNAVGYSGALQRLREAEAAAGKLYTTLLNQAAEPARTPDDRRSLSAEAEQARRAWDELVNRLRPMEKDAAEILHAAGRMWNVDDVLASQELIHIALREGLSGLVRRVRPKLKACATADEEDALWLVEIEKLFAALRANKFTAPPPPPPAPDVHAAAA